MTSWNEVEELGSQALGKSLELTQLNKREQKVKRDFWAKLKTLGRHLPFVEDLLAAYYCPLDPAHLTSVHNVCTPLLRISSNCIEDNIHSSHRLLESLPFV